MMQPRLRRRVRKRFERGHAQTVDAANVDDARGRFGRCGGFEEGRYGLCELEDAFEVEVEDAVPGVGGVGVV
jgi:hypothetical protein